MANRNLATALAQLAAAPEIRASTGAWGKAAGWARAAGIILLVLLVASAAYILVFSRGVLADAHRRNYNDLAVAANGLETWPADVKRLARTNFAPQRLQPATVAEQSEGWSHAAALDHPDFGSMRIRYAIRDLAKAPCPAGEIDPATGAPFAGPAFVRSGRPGAGPAFVVAGTLRIDDIWAADMPDGINLAGTPASRAAAVLKTNLPPGGPQIAAPTTADSPMAICFRVVVELDRLIALDRTGKGFAHLLVTDAAGTIVGQTGGNQLAIRSLSELRPSRIGVLDFGDDETTKGDAPTIGKLHRPAEIDIGNETYTVYARPFRLPGQPPPCLATPSSAGPPTATKPDTPPAPTAAAPVATCHAVALMPAATLRARWFAPPPLIVFGFAMVVLAALALFPALRLILIGGTESVQGLEITAVVAGLQMAASLAMLTLLVAIQVSAERHAAFNLTRSLAASMSASAGAEIAAVVAISAGESEPNARVHRALFEKPPPCLGHAATGTAYPAIDPKTTRLVSVPGQRLPIVESIILVGWNGRQRPGTNQLVDRDNAAVRIDVGRRPYFLDLVRGTRLAPPPPGGPQLRYTIDVVRAQTDGINKTVLAVDARPLSRGPSLAAPGRCADPGRLDGALIVPTLLRSFLAPVLPTPHRFLVIDRLQPGFPVLFHSDRERAGVEQFGPFLGGRTDIRSRLAAVAPGGRTPQAREIPPHVLDFDLEYDGRQQRFAARAVPGTNWAVLVFHADDDIDGIATQAGRQALYLWVAIGSLVVIGLYAAIRLGTGDRPLHHLWQPAKVKVGAMQAHARWRRFWPHEAAGPEYDKLCRLLAKAALLMFILITLGALAGLPGLAVIAALLIVIAAFIRIGARLAAIDPGDQPLSPATQRRFGSFVAMLLLCTAALPTLAFWVDALALVSNARNAAAYQSATIAVTERNRQTLAIQQVFDGIATPRPPATHREGRGVFPRLAPRPAAARTPPLLVSAGLRSVQQQLPPAQTLLCDGSVAGTVCGDVAPGVVARNLPAILWKGLDPSPAMLVRLLATLLLAAGLVAGLVFFGRQIFRALFGFGIPLAAVTLPRLWIDKQGPLPADDDYHRFGCKSLLVAPQQAVRERTLDGARAQRLDLVDATAAITAADGTAIAPEPVLWLSGKPRLAVTGLDLILRDPQRRRAALAILETLAVKADAAHATAESLATRAAAAIIASERAASAGDTRLAAQGRATAAALVESAARARRELVIITDRAPLDRILDAFEIEKQRASGDDAELQATRKAREELRWARLFQDFATFTFAPVDKIDDSMATLRIEACPGYADWPQATKMGVATLIDELRWLPGNVINGAIYQQIRLDAAEVAKGQFPLDVKFYREVFTPAVADWACSVRPSSREAAIEFVWGTVIEFYQQCWSSSTHGERLALDAIASGRFVNFSTALALKSLVRRGLVVLDPAPRLMNASFAAFVRLAERPETLAQWRSQQLDGGWTAARLPIVIGLAAMVIVLGVVVDASQSLGTLVPLLFAGAPALATTVATLLKRS